MIDIEDDAWAEDEARARPIVKIQAGKLSEVVNEAADAIASADVYQRAGELVRVVRVAETEADAARLEGTPEIVQLSQAAALDVLSACASWEKFDARAKRWRAADVPEAVAKALLARRQWIGVRPLQGVTEAPAMRPDGTILQEPGYDPRLSVVYLPNAPFQVVPESPTQADARAALAELQEVFADFPWRTPAEAAVPVAALLTILARGAIAGPVPGFLIDASMAASGKGRAVDAVSIIATGRGCPRTTYPETDEETEKVLFAQAMRGAPVVNIDDIKRPLCGGPLDKALTSETIDGRVLGQSRILTLRWLLVVFATGNNVEVRDDTRRRLMVGRLEPQGDRPELRRDFKHPNLLGWVRKERPRLARAALVILRAYQAAGRPKLCEHIGSFEAWTVIRASVLFAGGPDVADTLPATTGEGDPARAALGAFLVGLERWQADTGAGVTAKELVGRLWPGGEASKGDGWGELRDAILELAPPRRSQDPPDPRQLGKALAKHRGKWVGVRKLGGVCDRKGLMVWESTKKDGCDM